MNRLDEVDFGDKIESFMTYDIQFNLYLSNERQKINPLGAIFPVIYYRKCNDVNISLSPNYNLEEIKENLIKFTKNPIIDDTWLQILSKIFKCNFLTINRYHLVSKFNNPNLNLQYFKLLTESELEKLSNLCSILKEQLIKLNSEQKVFINVIDNQIIGYGFITREHQDFVEISVATIKSKRKNGFGSKTVNQMSEKINSTGKSIIYLTEEKNIASNKIAIRNGFEFISKGFIGMQTKCV